MLKIKKFGQVPRDFNAKLAFTTNFYTIHCNSNNSKLLKIVLPLFLMSSLKDVGPTEI